MFDSQRIKIIRKQLKLGQMEFSRAISVSQSQLSNMENDNIAIGADILERLCKYYNVNPYWMLFGTGEMFVNQKEYQLTDNIEKVAQQSTPHVSKANMDDILNVLVKLQSEVELLKSELRKRNDIT